MKHRRTLGAAERVAGLLARLEDPRAAWGEVLTLLASWPPDQDPASAVARVEAEAHRWPPHTRVLPRFMLAQLRVGDLRPCLRLIRVLDLRALPVRDRAALLRRMIAEVGVRELFALSTRYDRGEAVIEQLVAHITGLRRLHLGGSAIGKVGARRLAAWPGFAELQQLGLPNNNITDEGGEALLAAPQRGNLYALNLYGNCLSPAMIERMLAAPQWQQTRLVAHNQRPAQD